MKLSSNQEINDTIHRVVECQRRFIVSCVEGSINWLNSIDINNKDSIICFNLKFCFIDNVDTVMRDSIFTKLRYSYNILDKHLVIGDMVYKLKQVAKNTRNRYTPVLDQFSVAVDGDFNTYFCDALEFIDSSVYDNLKDIIDSVSSKELNDAPIMMEL